MNRLQLANKLTKVVDCTTQIWTKNSKIRIYLSNAGKKYGFVEIEPDGALSFALTSYATNKYKAVIIDADEEVEPDDECLDSSNNKPQTIQDSWKAYHRNRESDDYFYGAGDEESF